MSFLSSIIGSTVKTVLTPIAVAKDVVNVTTGEKSESTKKLLNSAVEDVKDAIDDLVDEEFM